MIVEQRSGDERRQSPTIPRVRDWITDLRSRGGDFREDAAEEAGRVAEDNFRTTHSEDAAFQAARIAYFEALKRRA